MIDPEHALPLTRQSRIVELSRSSLYYKAVPINERDLELMRLIDEIHLKYPFYGSRRIRNELRDMGNDVGRGHVSTLMQKMGIRALYQKPRLSVPHPDHKVYPSVARIGYQQGQSLLVGRHHVFADGQRILLPRGDHGLGKPPSNGMAALKHTGRLLLHRGA